MNQDNIQLRIIKELADIKKGLRKTTASAQLYVVLNESTPAQITASQNDYDPGYYDVLRLDASGAYAISGFSGGVKGRVLRVINVGNYTISFYHDSTLSLAANRIYSATHTTFSLAKDAWRDFYYDITIQRWRSQ